MSEVEDAFERGKNVLKTAEKFVDIDLPTAANRIYIAGENLARSLILKVSGSSPKDHGKIWNAIQHLYEKGVLKRNYKSILETSYRLRMKGDYGRDISGIMIISKRL